MRLLLRPPPPCLQSPQSFTRPNSHFSTTSSSSCSSSSSSSFSIFSFKPLNKRFHFLNPPHSSLKQTKKQQQQRTTTTLQTNNNTPPQSSIKRLLNLNNTNNNSNNNNNNDDENNENENGNAIKGTIVAGLLLVGVVGGFGTVGYIYRDQINAFLIQFSSFIEGYGPAGYALFVAVYAGLEVLAIPAIPLTMSAGLLFGSVTGTILVSISGTVAASVAFLIARYFARDRILKMVEGNKKFLAIDKAIDRILKMVESS